MRPMVATLAGERPVTEPSACALSVVIPVFNEAENLAPLWQELTAALTALGRSYEMILVDDGSTDGSWAIMESLVAGQPCARAIRLARRYGQTAAITAGVEVARGAAIVTMDADRQNDPADIARLLAKYDEGFDVVSGWRRERRDPFWSRRLPSQLANALISWVSGVALHDYGCTLKVYRRDILQSVRLYGEMHRFIPVYASWLGGRVAELPVHHRPRQAGVSKYGIGRTIRVVLDLLVVKFLGTYADRPIQLFGAFGLLSMAGALATGGWAIYLKVVEHKSFILTPLPLLTVLLLLIGGLSILMGLLAELIVRTYFESQQKSVYRIRDMRGEGRD